MPITPNMDLALPTVSTTIGPDWASELNAALDVVDSHDHSSGKGVQITPAGMNINTALDFQNNPAQNMTYVGVQQLASTISTPNTFTSVNGNAYFTNGSGVPVQITAGGALIPTAASVNTFVRTAVNSSLTISPSSVFVVVEMDTSVSANTVTLPSASAVADGRIYIIKDSTGFGRTNPITVSPAGTDTIDDVPSSGPAIVMNSRFGSVMLIGDGVSNWVVV